MNRLRGVLSGFFLGVLSDRVFVADITYQKDTAEGLLSALFEGPGYQVSHHCVRDRAPPINGEKQYSWSGLDICLKTTWACGTFWHVLAKICIRLTGLLCRGATEAES